MARLRPRKIAKPPATISFPAQGFSSFRPGILDDLREQTSLLSFSHAFFRPHTRDHGLVKKTCRTVGANQGKGAPSLRTTVHLPHFLNRDRCARWSQPTRLRVVALGVLVEPSHRYRPLLHFSFTHVMQSIGIKQAETIYVCRYLGMRRVSRRVLLLPTNSIKPIPSPQSSQPTKKTK